MTRFLIIAGLLLSLCNLASQDAPGGYYFLTSGGQTTIGHCHRDGVGSSYFHCHTVSGHGAMLVSEQFHSYANVILHGRYNPAAICLPATISPVPNQERGSTLSFLPSSPVGADIWYLGVSSGGIPS